MKLDPNKKYQTRDGRDVVIYCWDAPDTRYPIHGRIEGFNTAKSWTAEGLYLGALEGPFNLDLVEVPRKPRVIWVNEYPSADWSYSVLYSRHHDSREDAIRVQAGCGRAVKFVEVMDEEDET